MERQDGNSCVSLLKWINLSSSNFQNRKQRFGKVSEHNPWFPRDHWITYDQRRRFEAFARNNPLEGYRRMAYMMSKRVRLFLLVEQRSQLTLHCRRVSNLKRRANDVIFDQPVSVQHGR